MRVLVTGATGLLGNALARRLVGRGHDLTALVRDERRARAVLPESVRLAPGDITDPASLPPALAGIDVVFHAAGLPNGRLRDESVFDRVNRAGTEHVLAAALHAGVERVVYTSTVEVFRKDGQGVLREDNLDPQPKPSRYDRSMQQAARAAEAFHREGLDVVQLNPGAMYGPSPSRTGLNGYLLEILRGRVPVLPPGGFAIAYVDAVADAHLAAAEHGRPGERYLLADTYVTMAEFAAQAVRACGAGRIPRTAPAWLLKPVAALTTPLARAVGVTPPLPPGPLSYFLWQARVDAGKAQRELGYEPVPVERGIAATVRHFREQGRLGTDVGRAPR